MRVLRSCPIPDSERRRLTELALFPLLFAGLVASCGPAATKTKPEPQPAERAATPTPSPPNAGISIPAYPGLKVQVAHTAGPGSSVLQGTSADTIDKVSAWYEEQARTGGWQTTQPTSRTPDDSVITLHFGRGEQALTVTLVRQDQGTAVSVASWQSKPR
jgi:hypothetical protein